MVVSTKGVEGRKWYHIHHALVIKVMNCFFQTLTYSCFEVIVVQLYDETTSIDSNDNAYSNNNTRDYSIARTRIGTPFSAMVFSA